MNRGSGFIIMIAHVFAKILMNILLKPVLKGIHQLKTTLWWLFAMNIGPLVCIERSTSNCENTEICHLVHMWLDLEKGVFHTHPIARTWMTITWCSRHMQTWNFLHLLSYVRAHYWPNFRSIAFSDLKL